MSTVYKCIALVVYKTDYDETESFEQYNNQNRKQLSLSTGEAK